MVKKSSAVLACVIVGLCAVAVTASLMLGGFVVYGAHNGILSRTPQVTPGASGSPTTLDYSRLDEIRAVLHQEALTDVPDQQLVDGAAKGMVAGTGDVYANYFTADEYKQFNSDEEAFLWICDQSPDLERLEALGTDLRECSRLYLKLDSDLRRATAFFSETVFDALNGWGQHEANQFDLTATVVGGTYTLTHMYEYPRSENVKLVPDFSALAARGDWPGFE